MRTYILCIMYNINPLHIRVNTVIVFLNISNSFIMGFQAYFLFRFLVEIHYQNDTWVQANLCQKLLFLHQLTHNMTTDYSLFMKIVSSEYLQNMLCTQIVVFVLFWHSEQFWYSTCSTDVASFWKRFTCKAHVFLFLNHGIPFIASTIFGTCFLCSSSCKGKIVSTLSNLVFFHLVSI